ncbi:MAG: type VI secretion system protein TssA [Proteobacteria bacterium]|nr:type VI secretion system protein TssA [Pseudomonadota bacterium]
MDDAGNDPAASALAAPLPGDKPAGEDLRQDFSAQSYYYRLRDLRSEAREIERRLDHNDPEADATALPKLWRDVHDLAVKALTERTKDLEIAAWMTEALVRTEGLQGLATGAEVIAQLVETLWDSGLFPLPDEDGIVTRIAPITGLNGASSDGSLMQPLRKCALFPGADDEPVTYWRYKQSEDLESATGDRRKQWLAAGVVPLATMEAAARKAGAAHFAALRRSIRQAQESWTRMAAQLDTRAGADAPPTTRVQELLAILLQIAGTYAPPEDLTALPDAAPATDDAEAGAPATGSGAALTRTVTRDDMLRELTRIADYFRRTEPQSPLAYTLEEAVRRGRLTWPELLAELVTDNGVRNSMLNSLGIRPAPPES